LITIAWICEGDPKTVDWFYDNKTDAELLLYSYIKLESIKSGTNSNSLGKLLGL
jgi:hypothetical protein